MQPSFYGDAQRKHHYAKLINHQGIYPHCRTTCFFPLFPFFFPCCIPSPSLCVLSSGAPLPPPQLNPLPLAPASLRTAPLPYPNSVVVGFAAGGNAGNSPTLDRGGPRLTGRDDGGVGLADAGAEDGLDCAGVGFTHGVALTRPAPMRFADVVAGKPGNGFADEADAVPQDAFRDADDRDDCAVEDLSFKTREVLFCGAAGEAEGVDAVI